MKSKSINNTGKGETGNEETIHCFCCVHVPPPALELKVTTSAGVGRSIAQFVNNPHPYVSERGSASFTSKLHLYLMLRCTRLYYFVRLGPISAVISSILPLLLI